MWATRERCPSCPQPWRRRGPRARLPSACGWRAPDADAARCTTRFENAHRTVRRELLYRFCCNNVVASGQLTKSVAGARRHPCLAFRRLTSAIVSIIDSVDTIAAPTPHYRPSPAILARRPSAEGYDEPVAALAGRSYSFTPSAACLSTGPSSKGSPPSVSIRRGKRSPGRARSRRNWRRASLLASRRDIPDRSWKRRGAARRG
jgi:hypothetical protein